MSSATAALSELQQLTAVLEAEKRAAAALQKTLDDRESVVSAAQKQVVALRADVEGESKARVQLQIDMGEFEAKLKGLVTFMQRVQQKEKDDKASAVAAADAKNAADGKAPDPKAVVPKYAKRTAATMAPEQIVEACVTAFQRLRRTRGESLTDADHRLMASIRATPVDEYATPGARLLVGQYLAGVAALAVNAAASEAEALKHLKAQANDSRLLYHMFSIPANSAELTESERFEAECMRVDVATRLQNGPVLSELFNAMLKRTLAKLPPPLLVPMMTAAAQLGEWAALRDLGKHLEAKGENLRQLHDVALQQRGMPDLEQLYALSVVDGKARETAKPEDLKWAEYTITSSILKLKKIDSPDPEAAAAIANDFKEYPEGKELCSPDAVHRLLRCGAHAIYIAPEANAMPVTGPADDKTMHLHGWMEMKNGAGAGDITGRAQAADGGTTRQEETYILQFKSADPKARTQIWSGEYSMVNNVNDPAGPGLQLKCVFEATIVLEEVERDV